jgi:hypothetical protein
MSGFRYGKPLTDPLLIKTRWLSLHRDKVRSTTAVNPDPLIVMAHVCPWIQGDPLRWFVSRTPRLVFAGQ